MIAKQFQSCVLCLIACMMLSANAKAAVQTTIPQIQGEGHVSPLAGQWVSFEGVVTQLRDGSFFVLDPQGDGDVATSDGILIRRKPAGLNVGDQVSIEGLVDEQSRPGQFSTTTIDQPVYRKLGAAEVPAPVLIGGAGLEVPTEMIVSQPGSFDPAASGADFFERLEGMMVRIESPVVVGPTSDRNAFYVVADNGSRATGMNGLGGITATPGDNNPERIIVQVAKPLLPADFQVAVGDRYASLTGAVVTDNSAYGIQLADAVGHVPKAHTEQPVPPTEGEQVLTIASYNVENLDPKIEDPLRIPPDTKADDDMGDGKFQAIAKHIVNLLRAPDIVAIQEVQDNDGGEFSDEVASDVTLQTLVQAISKAGGPAYQFITLNPVDDVEGGQPGGNIRVAYLYRPDRVTVDPASVKRIADPSFTRTRVPLAAPFRFRGREVNVINVHFSSKSGSDPLYGPTQPPRDGTLANRIAQARAVREFIRAFPPDENRSVVVVGDFNSFWYEEPLLLLTGGDPALTNLALEQPPVERISYIYEGNSQSLDHMLVLLGKGQTAQMDTLHVNSVLPESRQTSDHDPKLLLLKFGTAP